MVWAIDALNDTLMKNDDNQLLDESLINKRFSEIKNDLPKLIEYLSLCLKSLCQLPSVMITWR